MRPVPDRLRTPQRTSQAGVTLIEFLVSVLVFAFGILGVMALQARALSYGQISLFRTQATALTDDVLDRMRADRIRARATTWTTALGQKAATYRGGSATTGDAFVNSELADWKGEVEALLPEGQAEITFDSGAGTVPIGVVVELRWRERGETQLNWTTRSIL